MQSMHHKDSNAKEQISYVQAKFKTGKIEFLFSLNYITLLPGCEGKQ